ncbi:gluconate 2-dehydrogenase gamma chain [Pseudomonas delhiensis]|uniref:Gluconate 2-dehydrogenase gamma chain n=1 Tax=Pseudomonas delhiensis TaxID=366289 RepID=A0A239HST3_9PSED|nr:gluconate 2-dehydrogenase subunit 3 family protein [Pseudomonas delhiensis]SDI46328.1 gluconate 2-dehydrogenase gamma chain [Pseudomonas delhiensis]SNS84245.1 gluconate 2-dehydrogenase gamma chain [Pseudomonas delhiensis]
MSSKAVAEGASRRRFLKGSLTLIPAVAVLGAGLVETRDAAAGPQSAGQQYQPLYFNAAEWQFLLAACDRLIPDDENGPGAVAEGVPEFIDRQMETGYGHGGLWYLQGPFLEGPAELGPQSRLSPREIYRLGIAEVQRHCQRQFAGKRFEALPREAQEAVLTQLERGEPAFEACPAALFFGQIWQNTREGYLADPVHGGNRSMASWRMIGFPGARADFTDWVDRPNQAYPQGPVSIAGKRGGL